MKKYILFTFVMLMALLSSCVTVKPPIPPTPSREYYSFDYSEVSRKYGVGFTESDAVNFDYDALSTVAIVEKGGYVESTKAEPVEAKRSYLEEDEIYMSSSKRKSVNKIEYTYVEPDAQKGLAAMAQEAIRLGGDYVLNLNVQRTNEYEDGFGYSCYTLSGMVVKKK